MNNKRKSANMREILDAVMKHEDVCQTYVPQGQRLNLLELITFHNTIAEKTKRDIIVMEERFYELGFLRGMRYARTHKEDIL